MKIMITSALFLLPLLLIIFSSCRQQVPAPVADVPPYTAAEVAQRVVLLLKAKDFAGLQPYTILDKGIRCTPYAYVDVDKDRVLSANALSGALADLNVYLWGSYDGTGDPITLTTADYYAKFISDKDYPTATQQGTGKRLGVSNSKDNSATAYPGATIYEFYYRDKDATEEMKSFTWGSLRLVLTEYKPGDWRLLGVIHDQWTI